MFKKIKEKDSDVDITSLNHILRTGKKIMNIGYFMAIIAVILLCTYLLKEWSILKYVGEFLKVISPIFIGFLIAWLFEPVVSFLEKKKVPRIIGCVLVYAVLLGLIFLFLYLLVPSLISQVKDFVQAAPAIFEEVTNFIIQFLRRIDANRIFDISHVKDDIMSFITEWGLRFGSDMPRHIFSFGKMIISGGLNIILGLMIGFYLLFDFHKVNHFISSLLPKKWLKSYHELTHRINTSLRSYVQGLFVVMFLVFITQSIGLTIAGMEAPIVFALFCAVTDIIPYFGPYIGAIPAVIVGFTISPITGICVIISIFVVQLLENNFYQPLIMGHTMKLHPVTIMIGLLIFQHFFGIIGMIVATPCIACLKVIALFVAEKTGYNKDDETIAEKENGKIEKVPELL